jgi:hypothetical protein
MSQFSASHLENQISRKLNKIVNFCLIDSTLRENIQLDFKICRKKLNFKIFHALVFSIQNLIKKSKTINSKLHEFDGDAWLFLMYENYVQFNESF